MRLLYRGALRLLVLLHDFPEFLCEHHHALCDVIPPNCIQMRNLVLSAFPRNMRLPDPFTPNLKVDLLPEISQSPRGRPRDAARKRGFPALRAELDQFLKTRRPRTPDRLGARWRCRRRRRRRRAAPDAPLVNASYRPRGARARRALLRPRAADGASANSVASRWRTPRPWRCSSA